VPPDSPRKIAQRSFKGGWVPGDSGGRTRTSHNVTEFHGPAADGTLETEVLGFRV